MAVPPPVSFPALSSTWGCAALQGFGMANTVRNWPTNCEPRTPCFGAKLNGQFFAMPVSYAVQFILPRNAGLGLPKCFAIQSIGTPSQPDNLVWDGICSVPGLVLSITFRLDNLSYGTDPDFGIFARDRVRWDFLDSVSGETGTVDSVQDFYRADSDVGEEVVTWSGGGFFQAVRALPLGWGLPVTVKPQCV